MMGIANYKIGHCINMLVGHMSSRRLSEGASMQREMREGLWLGWSWSMSRDDNCVDENKKKEHGFAPHTQMSTHTFKISIL